MVEMEQTITDPAEIKRRLWQLVKIFETADRGEFGDLTRPAADDQSTKTADRPGKSTMDRPAEQAAGG